jgi:zinc transport system substrate-binding protein
MKRTSLLLISLAAFSMGCGKQQSVDDNRLRVVASITPLADFAQRIGGPRVRVTVVVPPGMNPHVFDLTPEVLRSTSDAEVLLLNGAGLEFWADKLRENIRTSGYSEITATNGITLLGGYEHGNPHFWLDPVLAMDAVRSIRDVFATRDHEYAPSYRANAQQLLDSLELLHQWIVREVSTWKSQTFVAQHASWDYFAKRYELVQLATIERITGREISAREMTDLIRLMKESNTKALFAETFASLKPVETLARETGAHYAVLDPLGSPQTAMDYLGLMRYNVNEMSKVMR